MYAIIRICMLSPSPLVLVIFGATGDLTSRKLMPAIYALYQKQQLPPESFIVGVGRREITSHDFRELMKSAVIAVHKQDFSETVWEQMAAGMHYVQGFFEEAAPYDALVSMLKQFDEVRQACVPRFFYLATPPENYESILHRLQSSKLAEGCGQGTLNYTRVLIEKPFGKDLENARRLEHVLANAFEERQIYRIDHYLGKETMQNMLAFRFANGIFEPTWNHEFIDHVQITFAEDLGMGTRGRFYDGIGMLRDVVQNHMLQMLAVTAMEQPRAFDAASVRDERTKAIEAVHCIAPEEVSRLVVRGQYEAGVFNDHTVKGYREESGVAPDSTTETYVAMKLSVDTPRWKGVPFYLRAGKRMPKKFTEISLHYKKPALCFDEVCLFDPEKVARNVLTIRIQPDEGIALRLMVKSPGFGMQLMPAYMDFSYHRAFSDLVQPDAYERLLLDAIQGDMTLFGRTDEIDASWQLLTNILAGWKRSGEPPAPYAAGTWGPAAGRELVEKDGRHWFLYSDPVQ